MKSYRFKKEVTRTEEISIPEDGLKKLAIELLEDLYEFPKGNTNNYVVENGKFEYEFIRHGSHTFVENFEQEMTEEQKVAYSVIQKLKKANPVWTQKIPGGLAEKSS